MRSLIQLAIGLSFASLSLPTFAAEPSSSEDDPCFVSALEGQKLRKAGKLKAAHAEFAACARASCATEVVDHCTAWLKENDEAQPTVVFAAEDERGRDLMTGTVSVDGEVLPSALGGKAIAIDPGARVFRFESAGHDPIEERMVVREGDKSRKITFRLKAREPDKPATVPEKHDEGGGKTPTLAWVLGGVGVAALGVFGYFGARGVSDRKRFGCATSCSSDDYDTVQREFVIADIALGVAVVSLGASTVLFISSSGRDEKPQAESLPRSTTIGLGGVF